MVSRLRNKEKNSLSFQHDVSGPEAKSHSMPVDRLIKKTEFANAQSQIQYEEIKMPNKFYSGAFDSAAASAFYDKSFREEQKIQEDFKVNAKKVLSDREEAKRSQPKPLTISEESLGDSLSQKSMRADADPKRMSYKNIIQMKSLKTHKLTIQECGQDSRRIFKDSLLPDQGRKSRPLMRVRSSEVIVPYKY